MATNYVDSNLNSFDKSPSHLGPQDIDRSQAVVSVASGDADGDLYVLGIIAGDTVISNIMIENTAITGGTDYDLGVYLFDGNAIGAAVDADLLFDGVSVASARAGMVSIFTAPSMANRGTKTVKELLAAASVTTNADEATYALVLTANTVGSADGTIRIAVDTLEA